MVDSGSQHASRSRLKARVTGVVQGVGFRYATRNAAQRLGEVRGYVRNLPDGSVEVDAEGPRDQLERLASWLKKGPPGAHVRNLEARYTAYQGFYRRFVIE